MTTKPTKTAKSAKSSKATDKKAIANTNTAEVLIVETPADAVDIVDVNLGGEDTVIVVEPLSDADATAMLEPMRNPDESDESDDYQDDDYQGDDDFVEPIEFEDPDLDEENTVMTADAPVVSDTKADIIGVVDSDADANNSAAHDDSFFHLFFHAMSHEETQLYGNVQISTIGMFGLARANVLIRENFNVKDVVLLGWKTLTKADYEAFVAPVAVVHEADESRYFHVFFHAISPNGGQVHGNIQMSNKGMINLNAATAIIEEQFNAHNAIILGWEELLYADYQALIS